LVLADDGLIKKYPWILIAARNLRQHCRRNGIMRMSEFELLSDKDQLALLYKHGVYIGKRKTGGSVKLLFQLDSFYVEIDYVSYRLEISKMLCTDSTDILDRYLGQIQVEYLVT
jgi:hypothetical protein